MTDLISRDAIDAFNAAIAAADPYRQTRAVLQSHEAFACVRGRVTILAAGKAALSMTRAALDVIAAPKRGPVITVTNYENATALDGARVLGAGHPVPDKAGESAARAIEQAALDAGGDDLVICLISGGASALLPAPRAGLSLDDKMAVTDLLLRSGADISEVNTVRKALSRLKGGGLARAIAPARCLSLILSDVPGDNIAVIASGPTALPPQESDPGGAAMAVLARFGLGEKVPLSVLAVIETPVRHRSFGSPPNNQLIGSNTMSVDALNGFLREAGYSVTRSDDWLQGDAVDAARMFVDWGVGAPDGKIAFVAGGETSVEVTGSGLGGRNQHMALAFALEAQGRLKRPFAFLSGGTDGRDGPTDAAGGLVTDKTLALAARRGVHLPDYLANDDSYHGLKSVDGLVVTGGTGTNVADVQCLLLGDQR